MGRYLNELLKLKGGGTPTLKNLNNPEAGSSLGLLGPSPTPFQKITPLPARCGDCRNFVPDTVNPKGGLGACSAPGEQSKGLRFPFTTKSCHAFGGRTL